MDQAQMDLKRAEYQKHLKDVELDRNMIAKLRAETREARARGTPMNRC
ncbi:expressed unknown protein [Ectocarpus siliculosus]|uniref:Uncharacterized protein n=1 Tax=Ectocarpus siliculosus TaxID=2880 RepID=D7G078_ECTSI|nr:expressed unknown protein [Ectocarpus siliculosus]|eukprot:CBJ32960.1 expressed unknown protein [Ectocarpus siliculosus]